MNTSLERIVEIVETLDRTFPCEFTIKDKYNLAVQFHRNEILMDMCKTIENIDKDIHRIMSTYEYNQ